jgi:hypothetical protein
MSKASRRSLKVPSSKEQKPAEEPGSLSTAQMSVDETARYIAEFAAELSFLARRTNMDLLAYLLDMARLEAIRTIQMRERSR